MPQAQPVAIGRDLAAVHRGPPVPDSTVAAGPQVQAARAEWQVVVVARDLEPPPAFIHALRRVGRGVFRTRLDLGVRVFVDAATWAIRQRAIETARSLAGGPHGTGLGQAQLLGLARGLADPASPPPDPGGRCMLVIVVLGQEGRARWWCWSRQGRRAHTTSPLPSSCSAISHTARGAKSSSSSSAPLRT